MTFNQSLEELWGCPVVDYDPAQGLREAGRKAYRIRTEYDASLKFVDLLARFLEEPELPKLTALSIGLWAPESECGAAVAVDPLLAARDRLQGLRSLFFGDITFEEQEVSWIEQTDLGPLVSSLAGLSECFVRGGNNLRLTKLSHPALSRLVIQSGGLSRATIADVLAAQLPVLEELELWLGSDNYGFDAAVADFEALLAGRLFPRLRSLGLCNSIITDEIAAAVSQAPLLDRIQVLDLSGGTLSDAGAAHLLSSTAIKRLSKLDLHHHYLGEATTKRLTALPMEVDVSEGQDGDDPDDRYCAVSE
jgi:hypothetical protein